VRSSCAVILTREEKGGALARRFLEMLNTPITVLVVLVVVVSVNAFLFFGHYLPSVRTPTVPTSAPTLTTERTSAPPTTTVEGEDSEATEEQTQPATTPEVTTTATATASPTGSP
jgi:cytoskeletal protein RodZ